MKSPVVDLPMAPDFTTIFHAPGAGFMAHSAASQMCETRGRTILLDQTRLSLTTVMTT
jgi:hypothetical protein